jgi:hypothetical protein
VPGVAIPDDAVTTTLSPTLEAVSDVAGTVQLALVGVIVVALFVVVRRVRRLRRIRRAQQPEPPAPTS